MTRDRIEELEDECDELLRRLDYAQEEAREKDDCSAAFLSMLLHDISVTFKPSDRVELSYIDHKGRRCGSYCDVADVTDCILRVAGKLAAFKAPSDEPAG